MKNIVWSNEKNIKPELVGGKAWRLIQLVKHDFNIPKFFVITTRASNSSSFYLEEEILESFDKLACRHVAVRSSATCEDSQNSSFAGQFESYLAIPRGRLMETIKKCWASTKSERVLAYATHHGIPLESIKIAVIVQKMIFAGKGGDRKSTRLNSSH
jgi:pyruvate,water dikinase